MLSSQCCAHQEQRQGRSWSSAGCSSPWRAVCEQEHLPLAEQAVNVQGNTIRLLLEEWGKDEEEDKEKILPHGNDRRER